MAEKKPYYITTAIAYASGKPHIGNTYEAILADAIARFLRAEDEADEQDELASRPSLLRPASLPVSRHLVLHLLEVLLLFVSQLVVVVRLHGAEVEPVGHAGEIPRQQTAGVRLLHIELERLHDACASVVERIVVSVSPFDVLDLLSLGIAVVLRASVLPCIVLLFFLPCGVIEASLVPQKLLQFPSLAVKLKAKPEQCHGASPHVQIEVQPQPVGPLRPPVGRLDLVFHVALEEGQLRVGIPNCQS